VLTAANSWLHSQNQRSHHRYDKDKGYVCTLSALVIKGDTAHIFHVGDTRVYRLTSNALEQLTNDHRLWVTQDKSYLSRALGIDNQCEIDYQSLRVNQGDTFILATDGIYEFLADAQFVANAISDNSENLDLAAKSISEHAYEHGSEDNLSIQIIRIDELPGKNTLEVHKQINELPLPPLLTARMKFDGYLILRQLHASSRSHVYLALDEATDTQAVIKIPSIDLRDNPAYLERFLMEEWIARRINSANVLKASLQDRKRSYLYTVSEFVEGQTLAQWLIDNPKPDMETVREMIEQIAKGLRAFHRMEMLHQDLNPGNIMIDKTGTVKIIDFGSTWVAGLAEKTVETEQSHLLGTALFSAPEYFIGESGTQQSDQFSLAVLAYYMLSGRFPYGTKIPGAKSVAAQRKLQYRTVLDNEREIPAWVDGALQKATQISPHKRYDEISQLLYDLRHPNKVFLSQTRPPLIERNPVAFWQGLSLILAAIILLLLNKLY
jgi:serine/threonine protein kinase